MKYGIITVLAAFAFMLSGCVSQGAYDSLKMKNETQSQRISELESKYNSAKLELKQLREKLETARELENAGEQAAQEEIKLLEEALKEKNELVKKLQKQLLEGGVKLPAELNVMLEEFASANPDLVTFDSERGVVKFKSDLTFSPGSDNINSEAKNAIAKFCGIVKSDQAEKFDIVIAGHTDDMKISKPSTKREHPTNWHLSAHRAISVLQSMLNESVSPERLSVRGYGEYRPVAPNKPNNGGNVKNRRVEIYIVPQG
ncbi:OmpA family protein [Sedimentisphaera salicampi]|uniref:OmpA-like domain-containing protein n=1 Tax=Sedimentisphaera salicampi TaxID=1941349 RepID=A0A1W6LPV2_9BACT|nr:OmpA family protein [Sedimentisphaera salicampi]ARN57781.1 hypothetical protein STSP1_02207 [Sedimentisphaera salicampi]OXU13945.1 hypothetical protein SMSP1_02106 [Sedimentisphaera salicampi]